MKTSREQSGNFPRDIYTWPAGVAEAIGQSVQALQRQRALGDAPKLYAITERKLVTTGSDLLEWVRAKAVPHGYKCRPPVRAGRSEGRAQPVESGVNAKAAR